MAIVHCSIALRWCKPVQRLDLVDEYRFVVHPVVAGHGPFLFSGLQPSLRLKFVTATRLKSGIVALHYRRR